MLTIGPPRPLSLHAQRDALRIFVLVVIAIVVWAQALKAQVPVGTGSSDPTWTPGPEADAEVRRHFAGLWGMEPQDILIEWGTLPRGRKVESGPTRFVGSGTGGVWIAYFESVSGSDFGVRVRIGSLATMWTATRRLARGTVLAPEHMSQVESSRWGAPSQKDPDVMEGWVTERVINAGEELTSPAVAPPIIVAAGALVEVVWQTASLRLSTRGKAIRRGRLGDLIGVRLESRRTVRGTVVGPGLVQIEGGSR